jgi:hypothetical protein
MIGKCKHDSKKCDGDSNVCRLNPSETEPTFIDEKGTVHSFFNRQCSAFIRANEELARGAVKVLNGDYEK